VEGDVAVQIRPAALADAFGPQIAEQMDKAFKDPSCPRMPRPWRTLCPQPISPSLGKPRKSSSASASPTAT
jgi:hypothetical protein